MDSGTAEPFFSIICPCYNQGHYLKEAVQSVLNQDFLDWELFIIDDGSTDSTFEVANLYAQSDSRIKLIRQENRGLSAARNAGLELASGEWIHLLDSDDIVLNNAYRIVYKTIEDYKPDVLVGSYSYFDESGDFYSHFFSDQLLDNYTVLRRNIAPPVAFFFRKELITNIGNFDTTLKSCEDWDFWNRASRYGARIYSINEIVAGYRYSLASMSRKAEVMYESLCEVSHRASLPDPRISKKDDQLVLSESEMRDSLKSHLVYALGIMLHQGDLSGAISFYYQEQNEKKFVWTSNDWNNLSSSRTWRHFSSLPDIAETLKNIRPQVEKFLKGIGYSKPDIKLISRKVFTNQLKKRNHFRYGKLIGAMLNKLGMY